MTLISEKSVLNRINELKSRESIKFSIEALVIVIKMVDVSYSRLVSLLNGYKESSSEEVFMQNWLVIGNLNRLRCLIEQVPGIKKKEPWFQIFSRKINDVEDLRHLIEHYDKQLRELILKVKPLLGHISWVIICEDKKLSINFALPGIIRKYKGLELVNPVGKSMRFVVDHITYYLGDKKLNISNLYYDLVKFTQNLEKYIKKNYFKST